METRDLNRGRNCASAEDTMWYGVPITAGTYRFQASERSGDAGSPAALRPESEFKGGIYPEIAIFTVDLGEIIANVCRIRSSPKFTCVPWHDLRQNTPRATNQKISL